MKMRLMKLEDFLAKVRGEKITEIFFYTDMQRQPIELPAQDGSVINGIRYTSTITLSAAKEEIIKENEEEKKKVRYFSCVLLLLDAVGQTKEDAEIANEDTKVKETNTLNNIKDQYSASQLINGVVEL